MQNKIIFINPENATDEEVKTWRLREAARGIVVDDEGKIAMLNVSVNNYYKLPGGGIDEGEDKETAFERECLEEIGCNVEIIGELGTIEEWRKIFTMRQISYCYVGKVVGEKGQSNFTESEKENGFEIVWLDKEDALQKLKNSVASNLEGEIYIKVRDVAILEEYLKK